MEPLTTAAPPEVLGFAWTARIRVPLGVDADTTQATSKAAWDCLDRRLAAAGYEDRAVYPLGDGGFALVCQVEHIGKNGSRVKPEWGWSPGSGLMRFFGSMLAPQPDFYRVIAFAVPATPAGAGRHAPDSTIADLMVRGGQTTPPADRLQHRLGRLECDVLIFEFIRPREDALVEFLPQSTAEASTQLVRAGLWKKKELKP
jgi:hypothetical protein